MNRRANPLSLLAIAMRVAAARIASDYERRKAAREADALTVSFVERNGAHTLKGTAAQCGRQIMRELPEMNPEDYPAAADALRGYASILTNQGPVPVVSESWLGQRGRSQRQAVAK